jgi:hypothetical protein
VPLLDIAAHGLRRPAQRVADAAAALVDEQEEVADLRGLQGAQGVLQVGARAAERRELGVAVGAIAGRVSRAARRQPGDVGAADGVHVPGRGRGAANRPGAVNTRPSTSCWSWKNGVFLVMNSDSKPDPPRWRPSPAVDAFTCRPR